VRSEVEGFLRAVSDVRSEVEGFLRAVSDVRSEVEGVLRAVSGVRSEVEGVLRAVSAVRRKVEGFLNAASDVRGETGFLAAMGAGGGAGATYSRLALGAEVTGTIIVVTTGLCLAGGSGAGADAALTLVEGGAVPLSWESVCAITRPLLRILKPPMKLSPSISRGDRYKRPKGVQPDPDAVFFVISNSLLITLLIYFEE
jgi:hypothetical protein